MAEWSIIPPTTPEQWRAYYQLRYKVLRKPWGQAEGTEYAEDDDVSLHGMIFDKKGDALAVGRIHFTATDQAQLRFMAVRDDMQGLGLGKTLLHYLEKRAQKENPALIQIVLEAREHAVTFYEKQGYFVIDKSYVLFGSIQHFRMIKSLI
jgi:GNAT superfamily N-acetyltransferase